MSACQRNEKQDDANQNQHESNRLIDKQGDDDSNDDQCECDIHSATIPLPKESPSFPRAGNERSSIPNS